MRKEWQKWQVHCGRAQAWRVGRVVRRQVGWWRWLKPWEAMMKGVKGWGQFLWMCTKEKIIKLCHSNENLLLPFTGLEGGGGEKNKGLYSSPFSCSFPFPCEFSIVTHSVTNWKDYILLVVTTKPTGDQVTNTCCKQATKTDVHFFKMCLHLDSSQIVVSSVLKIHLDPPCFHDGILHSLSTFSI